ncbi:outer membrane protein assembly factor BamA [Candidatus Pelagibacter sp. HIMB1321]|uniref:outer membrane protein assembly factor BamA n=1 Tax=Candidatus Pelagibacter sp. HIMB1321 TaxID=1388755 RepID=UPI000A07E580|nr:outer membrane protein assembly factor BamA [Candidatus Pelagibacter sp. HIMB1321]SMF74777.1 Beta-barrel assembly machine subunit BamA [Candidatus Pelagibacter sp. HIMB1321]
MIKKLLFILFILTINAQSAVIKDIVVDGNNRVSKESIQMFSTVKSGDDIDQNKLNTILKDLYETNFFKNVTLSIENNILKITVEENPIVQNYFIEGIKNKSLLEVIEKNILFKAKSSFDLSLVKKDRNNILFILKKAGYYFSDVDIFTENLENNKIDLTYKISLGEKAKINKIKFIGDKVFKDNKLSSIILSEEYRFWKFLSGKKYLNEDIISIDERLLKNFYLNKGFYNVNIKSSFAKLNNDDQFELIFNIIPGQKIYFNNLSLKLPDDYNENNFTKINNLFNDLKNKPYSLNEIENILDEIEDITINEEFSSIKAVVNESIISDKINLEFSLNELDPSYLNVINIYGNNITEETVIRNQIIIDEGDAYNEILLSKSINNIKSLNIFRSVKEEIIIDDVGNRTLNIIVEEKPTGEITAGAGYGTNGGTLSFSVKENNFLGKGIIVDNSINLSETSIKGGISIVNPNYKNTNNSLSTLINIQETDLLSTNGYKSDIMRFHLGTNFEYLDDLYLGVQTKNSFENLEVGSKASANQKKQAGDYFDSFLNFNFNYDKRNQKFETTDGFFSNYSVDIPIISESLTFINSYKYKNFKELYENNVSTFSFLFKSSNSLNNDNVRLSERLYIPQSNLRGFESGKIGPKDGNDYVGGNFASAVNLTTNLPNLTENFQNLDLGLFLDAANVWSVDYDSSLENNDGIRSAVGIGLDWSTPIGPLTFSLAQPITKKSTDVTETFRFNIGTSF